MKLLETRLSYYSLSLTSPYIFSGDFSISLGAQESPNYSNGKLKNEENIVSVQIELPLIA